MSKASRQASRRPKAFGQNQLPLQQIGSLAFYCSFARWRNLRPVRTHTRPPLVCVRDDSVAKFNGVIVTFSITIKLKSQSIRRIKHSHSHQSRQCKSIDRITHCFVRFVLPFLANRDDFDRTRLHRLVVEAASPHAALRFRLR